MSNWFRKLKRTRGIMLGLGPKFFLASSIVAREAKYKRSMKKFDKMIADANMQIEEMKDSVDESGGVDGN
jgi:hypothetical protein